MIKRLNYIILILVIIIIPFFIKSIFISTFGDTLITYLGSIFGGIITLLGVYYTIKYESDKRKKDLELQYLPIINSCVTDNIILNKKSKILRFISGSKDFNDLDFYDYKKAIKITNVGRGEILNVDVSVSNYELVQSLNSSSYYLGFLDDTSFINLIPINDSFYIFLDLPKLKSKNTILHLSVELDLCITSLFNKVYHYRLSFIIYIDKDNYDIFNINLILLDKIN